MSIQLSDQGSLRCMPLNATCPIPVSGHCYPKFCYKELRTLRIQIPHGPVCTVFEATEQQFRDYVEHLLSAYTRGSARERVRREVFDGIAESEPMDEVARFYILNMLASYKLIRAKLFVG